MNSPFPVTVRPYTWWNIQERRNYPTIRIQVGNHFVILPIEDARQVVDEVHDLCDQHDRTQRGH